LRNKGKSPSLLDDWGPWGWLVVIGLMLFGIGNSQVMLNVKSILYLIFPILAYVGLILTLMGAMKVQKTWAG
jgi:hypothetical protein